MINLRYAFGIGVILLTIGGPPIRAGEADPNAIPPPSPASPAGARSNPFGTILASRQEMELASEATGDAYPAGMADFGPLSLEMVELKYLGAKGAAEAFRALCSPAGKIVAQEGSNTLLIFDTRDNLNQIVTEIKKADRPTAGLSVETVNLKFLQAKNLTSIVTKMLTQYGQVSANETSNSVIICDTQENLVRILDQIRKADQTPQQIVVEVVLLDVQLGNDTEIGINWDYLSQQADDVGYRQNFTAERLSMVPDTDAAKGMAFNTLGMGGELSVVTGTVRNVVHLIQQRRNVQIIASPRAMMVSGQSAKIEAAQEIPYLELTQTSGGGSINSTQFKPVGVTLEVTATLTDESEIFLKVATQQSVEVDRSVAGVPVVDKRSETTSLLLKDGQIVVMGGLRRQEKSKRVTHIPLIGDLPVVGNLFKSTKNVVSNAELVVLLSPHIYKGEPVPPEVMAKIHEVKVESVLTPPTIE
jgi:type II secretory pathway component GspD/PulD (secretin)